jgi:hypothetical protein
VLRTVHNAVLLQHIGYYLQFCVDSGSPPYSDGVASDRIGINGAVGFVNCCMSMRRGNRRSDRIGAIVAQYDGVAYLLRLPPNCSEILQ